MTHYIQPHVLLADNIVSHRVTNAHFLTVLDRYGGYTAFKADVVTRYYQSDLVLEVCADSMTCYKDQETVICIEGDFEIVNTHRHMESILQFRLDRAFDHERQAIVLTQKIDGATLVMEILISGITPTAAVRVADIIAELKDDVDGVNGVPGVGAIVSLSFRLEFTDTKQMDDMIPMIPMLSMPTT